MYWDVTFKIGRFSTLRDSKLQDFQNGEYSKLLKF